MSDRKPGGALPSISLEFAGDEPDKAAIAMARQFTVYVLPSKDLSLNGNPQYVFMGNEERLRELLVQYCGSDREFAEWLLDIAKGKAK